MYRGELKASLGGLGVLIVLFVVLAFFSGTSSAVEAQVSLAEHNLQGFLLEWYAWQSDVRATPEERRARWARCQRLMTDALASPTWALLIDSKRLPPADFAALKAQWEARSEAQPRREDGRLFEMALRRVLTPLEAFAEEQRGIDATLRQLAWAGVTATLLVGGLPGLLPGPSA